MAVEPRLYSVDEFEAFIRRPENKKRLFELIHGEIVEKAPTQLHGRIVAAIVAEIYAYLKAHPIGHVETEVRHRNPDDAHNDVLPDVSVTLDTQTPPLERGPVMGMPDMAVEVKSPDDGYAEIREKAVYYLSNGTRLVWLVYPEKKLVEVYRSLKEIDLLDVTDTLDGGQVLPGFTLAVKDVFPA